MPKPHSRKETKDQWQPSLIKQGHSEQEGLRIDFALEKLVRRLDRGAMTANQINQWHEDLASYPVEAIEYAFDFFGKNATNSKFPKPKTISDLCESWWLNSDRAKRPEPGCGKCEWTGWITVQVEPHRRVAQCECVTDETLRTKNPSLETREGRGYGWPDIMLLWKLCNAKMEAVKRKPTDSEWEEMFVVVDKARGQVPAWRA